MQGRSVDRTHAKELARNLAAQLRDGIVLIPAVGCAWDRSMGSRAVALGADPPRETETRHAVGGSKGAPEQKTGMPVCG
jgi:hypothetical protein